jgi:ATPase subunit of ABC transporter with duplicated ATPase domains
MQFAGNELLQNSTIQLNGGHRYGLVGRNGCGKSTLLRRLEAHAVPGIPHDLRILLVKQQIEGNSETALEALMSADRERVALVEEQAALEESLGSTSDLEQVVERITEIATDLDAMDADQAEEKAKVILKGLQFSTDTMNSPTEALSGGWRMR